MGHIEQNKCKFIGRDDFHKHRAEQQIVKDAIAELTDPYSGATVLTSGSSEIDGRVAGINLLENERVSAYPVDWEGNIIGSSATESTSPSGDQATLSNSVRDNLDRYPALKATSRAASSGAMHVSEGQNAELLDVQQQPQVRQPAPLQGAWATKSLPVRSKQPSSSSSVANASEPAQHDDASSDLLGSSIHPANAWQSFQQRNVARSNLQHSSASSIAAIHNSESNTGRSILVSPRSGNSNTDPDAHIQVQARLRLQTQFNLQKYWNSIEQVYVCPGIKCGKRLRSQKEFEDHLLSGAHSSNTVRCPSCMKKFQTTTALLNHIESGSIKCRVREAADIDSVLREVTAGMIALKGFGEDGRLQYQSVPVEEW